MPVGHVKSNVVPDFTGTVTGYNSQGSTTTYAATDLVRPSDWNSVHSFNQSLSGQVLGGATTASGTDLVFGFTNGMQASFSTVASAAGRVTLWFDGGTPLKGWHNNVPLISTATHSAQSIRWIIQPLQIEKNISFDFVRLPVTFITTGTETNATTANTSFTGTQAFTYAVVVFTKGTGASSQSLMSFISTTAGMSNNRTLTANSTGSQYTIVNHYLYNISNTTSVFTTSRAISQTNFGFTTGIGVDSVSGPKLLDIPMAVGLGASNYWIAFNYSSTSSAQVGTAIMASRLDVRNYAMNQDNLNFAYFGAGTNTAAKYDSLGGLFTNNGAAHINQSIVSSTASNPRFPVTFGVT